MREYDKHCSRLKKNQSDIVPDLNAIEIFLYRTGSAVGGNNHETRKQKTEEWTPPQPSHLFVLF